MPERRNFTDAWIRNLQPQKDRTEYLDKSFRGLGLRVSPAGRKSVRKTFFLMQRFPGSKHPTRRTIFEYMEGSHEFGLASARATASRWVADLKIGVDTRAKEMMARTADDMASKEAALALKLAAKTGSHTFKYVVQRFLENGASHMRESSKSRFRTTLEGRLMTKWRDRHITQISRADIKRLLEEYESEGKVAQGYNAFAHLRCLFNWAITSTLDARSNNDQFDSDEEDFGIEKNPCEKISARRYLKKDRAEREYVMSADEIRAVWIAAGKMEFPYQQYFRLLFLLMQRRAEVADAVWSEFDMETRLWTIPKNRMKGKREHVVPLPDEAMKILQSLPKFSSGYLFSSGKNKRSASAYDAAKKKLSALALEEMRAIYSARGQNPDEAKIGFRIHDIRRAGRTGLSNLGVRGELAEMIIAHRPPKIWGTYDKGERINERRSALEAWADYLIELVESKPSNIVRLWA
jgi:integrase